MMTVATTAPFDAELIARYGVTGPRYTSYPSATCFHDGFDAAQLRAVALDSNEDPIPRPLSLYVHVPFCTSLCFYCGCNRVITRDKTRSERYLNNLYREVEMMAPLFDRDREVVQLHFGGGTPNFLDAEQMGELLTSLGRHFGLSRSADREFGIEIDPRFADGDYMLAMGELGFNRLSVGIQDFDPAVQQAVNRIQSLEQTREVLAAAREAQFRSVSVDLIYGLPRQTLAGFSHTLEQVIEFAPDRIAVYGYAHLPKMFKAQRQIKDGQLPDAATRLALFGRSLQMLEAAGCCCAISPCASMPMSAPTPKCGIPVRSSRKSSSGENACDGPSLGALRTQVRCINDHPAWADSLPPGGRLRASCPSPFGPSSSFAPLLRRSRPAALNRPTASRCLRRAAQGA